MRKYFLIIISLFVAGISFSQHTPRTILAIFAHHDDENMIGPVLAKYAAQGTRVYVLIATTGKYGNRVTKIPEGDSLAAVSKQETICACKLLGVEPPIDLYLDRLDIKINVRNYLTNHKKLRDELKTQIQALKPDLLITFGPDGEYGHSEHIVVGATVTELLLREGWVEQYPLYYAAWKKQQVSDNDDLSYVADKYIDVEIRYSEEEERKSIEAGKCYLSQYTQKEMEESIELMIKDSSNITPFRKFTAGPVKKVKQSF